MAESSLHSNHTFVKQLNHWGRAGIPFVFLIDFLGKKPRAWRLDEADLADLRFDLNGLTNEPPTIQYPPLSAGYFRKFPVGLEAYRPRFEHVIRNIQRGNSFLVNLSAPTPIETNLSLLEIYQHSRTPYRFWLRDQFVCFSPETFLRIKGNRMVSFPMKGTISAEVPEAEQTILADIKETAEHATIVDLIRNDLSSVASRVWVERYRFVERITTNQGDLLQVSSEVAGLLPERFAGAYGDLLLKLLPAGSISGAPKPSTLKIIREAEGYERGYYTGVMGAFDGEVFESAVMIRYIEQQRDGFIFKSGGGITALSRAEAEHQELIDKVYLPFGYESSFSLL